MDDRLMSLYQQASEEHDSDKLMVLIREIVQRLEAKHSPPTPRTEMKSALV